MELKALKITLLNHLFYHTEISNGSITGGFLGDLALTYALNKAINKDLEIYEHRLKPNYKEIADFEQYLTVGKPVKVKSHNNKAFLELAGKPTRTGSYTRNTLFNTDGYYDKDSITKSGKSPFKNLIHTQGVVLKSQFISLLISEKQVELPPTLRVGNQKETLLKLEEIPVEHTDNDFWLNAYTLKVVFDNLQQAMDISIEENGSVNYQYILENYALLKGFSGEQVKMIFNQVF
ncbi:MAG: type I-D CRISPR-associated protein Cas5/Csc1 [bacterium]